jgi:hypothetical protein
MRSSIVIASLIGMGALLWFGLIPSSQEEETPIAQIEKRKEEPPTNVHTDGVDIFQKAFWRRLDSEDRILHAERREWADADGVRKWQWFLEIEPSPGLVKHLRESHHLALTPTSSAEIPANAPAWFSFLPNEMDTLQRSGGSLQLCFNREGSVLYATESGVGFTKGTAVPDATPVAQTVNPGRLPTTPPPNPKRP